MILPPLQQAAPPAAVVPSEPLPFPLEVDAAAGRRNAPAWAAAVRDGLHERLLVHGALVLRGLGLGEAGSFREVARALLPDLMPYVGGQGPRTHLGGEVYTSSDAPPGFLIPLHSELAYTRRYPRWLAMACLTPPGGGGETPITPLRAVTRDINPAVREAFARRRIRYVANLPRRRGLIPGRTTWPAAFGTTSREAVETHCRGLEARWAWTRSGLRIERDGEATVRHPVTGEVLWFNQAHVFHRSWSWEADRAGLRAARRVSRLIEAFEHAFVPGDRRSTHATFADGTEIPRPHLDHVRETLWRHAALVRWNAGDLLLLDNLLVMHGRMPYRPPRRLLTVLGGALHGPDRAGELPHTDRRAGAALYPPPSPPPGIS